MILHEKKVPGKVSFERNVSAYLFPHLAFERELEDSYNEYTANRHKKNLRMAYLLFALLYALFGVTDFILVPEWFPLFFAIRFCIVIPVFLLTVILTFHLRYQRWEQWILLASFITGGAGIAVMLVLEPTNGIYYGGLFLVLTAGYFMLHLRTRLAIAGGGAILSIFITGVLAAGNMNLIVFSVTLFLIAENIIGAFGAYQLERFRRNEFLKIHDLNQTQARLEHVILERNRYLEGILQTSGDGFLVVDSRENIVHVNDAYGKMSGFSLDELRRLAIDDILDNTIPEHMSGLLQRIIVNGSEIYETRHRRKDGTVFDVEVSASYLDIDEGQLIFFCRDISDRKRSEERIRSLLAGKELLLKEVHHRIKNNLTSISGLLDLQSRSYAPEIRNLFQVAMTRVDSMRVLYDKLLSSEHYEKIPCKSFVEDIIAVLVAFFPDTVDIRIEASLDDFELSGKQLFPLGIIVNEIITNIMKYAFVGKSRGCISVTLVKTGETATLSIKDDGVGLPDGFDPDKVSGLGLMLVRMLAEQLEGTFTMQGGSGTTSRLVFGI